jgi:hypothetical protein
MDFAFDPNLPDEELQALYEEYEKKVTFMELENTVFESHMNRVNPQVLKGENAEQKTDPSAPVQTQDNAKEKREDRKKKRGDKAKENEMMLTLTPEQKSEVCNREVEELREEIDKEKDKWEKSVDNYKVV